jgi:arylsulfatase A-like enzyme
VRANAGTIPILDSDVTMAEVLRSAVYATGGFGKWGLGDARTPGIPTRQGFDEFFGYLHQVHAHSYYPEFLWDNDRRYMLPNCRMAVSRCRMSRHTMRSRGLRVTKPTPPW